jgi:hypothetical protein
VCNDPNHGFCLSISLSKLALENATGWNQENGEGKIVIFLLRDNSDLMVQISVQ